MKGYLRVHVHTACKLFPLKNARVEIFRYSGRDCVPVISVLTDENGYTSEIPMELNDNGNAGRRFEVFAVTASSEGFADSVVSEAAVYEDAVTVHSLEMILRETV